MTGCVAFAVSISEVNSLQHSPSNRDYNSVETISKFIVAGMENGSLTQSGSILESKSGTISTAGAIASFDILRGTFNVLEGSWSESNSTNGVVHH